MRSSTVLASAALLAACSAEPSSPSSSSRSDRPADDEGSSPPASSSSGSPSPGTSSSSGAPSPTPGTTPTLAAEPKWNDGTKCTGTKDFETWQLDASTFALRQSICTNYEAPFLYLFVGDDKALLVDSGTGDADVVSAVDAILAGKDLDLVVARSHAHGDHTGGEADLSSRPRTTLIGKPKTATIDLGNRVLDVIPIPGHEASHVAYYDAKTRILLTGDTLYPGRLYVNDFTAYKSSVAKLVDFVDKHPPSLVLGAHVELSNTGTEFKAGLKTHPNEHPLSLAETDLRDLYAATQKMSAPARVVGPRWIIVPVN